MALTHLLDTSVVKRLGRPQVREIVEPLAAARELGRPSICDLEVRYSARNAVEWDHLVGALDAFDPVATTAAHVRRALQVQRLLARRSQCGRKIPDLLVAAAARRSSTSLSSTTTPTSTSSARSPGKPASGSCQRAPWSTP